MIEINIISATGALLGFIREGIADLSIRECQQLGLMAIQDLVAAGNKEFIGSRVELKIHNIYES